MVKEIMGLSDAEVIASREKSGSNRLSDPERVSFFKKLIKNLGDPIIRILIVAFFVTLLFSGGKGGFLEAVGIAASILISTLVSTVSEYGSEKAFRKMQLEAANQKCEVIRSGKRTQIAVDSLVVGDFVVLNAGDKIGADGVLTDGKISCDMSAINGESAEVHKSAGKSDTELGEPTDENSLFRGALVTAGNGIMLVKRVGSETYYGKIANELRSENDESPLRAKLTALAKTLSKFGYFCAFCVSVAYLLNAVIFNPQFVFSAKNVAYELLHAITLAVSVVVVAVPEGLPMMITVVLSSNMIRMQRQNIRVRKAVGIETAGNVDILFTDKTGTLTYGCPTVISYTSGLGARSRRCVDLSRYEKTLFGLAAMHTGDSRMENTLKYGKSRAVSGNATDRALLEGYITCKEKVVFAERIAYLPFDSRIKLSCATVSTSDDVALSLGISNTLTLIKGAPELLLKYCNSCYGCDGIKKKIDKRVIFDEIKALSKKGIRTVAVITSDASADVVSRLAEKVANGEEPGLDSVFKNACFLSLVAIRDDLRKEAPKSIKSLKKAGIQTVMITGDARDTAVAIAREAGIVTGKCEETILESTELRTLTDLEISELLPTLRVVARALPEDKSRLVRIAKSCGRITAMTGDGLNDAPALKAADVGFAMGSGTDVAKEAGDIIISDNDISSIKKAVLYGRTIFRAIRKFIVFQLIMNLSAVGISIIGPFIGFEHPVTVIQMLWINLIMDTLAALAFAGEAPHERYMKEPPTPRSEPVLSGDMITRIFSMGVYCIMLCLWFLQSEKIAYVFGGRESAPFASGFFALFVFCAVFGAFFARSGRVNIFSGLLKNPVFVAVIGTVFLSQIGLIYFGGSALRCAPLTANQLKTVIRYALTVIPAGILLEIVMRFTHNGKKKEVESVDSTSSVLILLARSFKTASELINASAGINKLLLAGKERVTLGADI